MKDKITQIIKMFNSPEQSVPQVIDVERLKNLRALDKDLRELAVSGDPVKVKTAIETVQNI